jgi:hypothetical protein
VPHQGLDAAPEVMLQMARFTGAHLESATGEYHTCRGNLRGSLLRPCVKTMLSDWPSGKYMFTIGMGQIPCDGLCDGLQLTGIMRGRSEICWDINY